MGLLCVNDTRTMYKYYFLNGAVVLSVSLFHVCF